MKYHRHNFRDQLNLQYTVKYVDLVMCHDALRDCRSTAGTRTAQRQHAGQLASRNCYSRVAATLPPKPARSSALGAAPRARPASRRRSSGGAFGRHAPLAATSGPTTSGSSTPCDRACSSTSRSSSERVGNPHFSWQNDPPTALAVTAEGASCAARAVPSGSVSCMLAARRVPTDRFADGVPGAGRKPSASLMTNASSAPAPKPGNLRNDKYAH